MLKTYKTHKIYNLYIHIPFCIKKCDYCDFVSFNNIKEQNKYVDYLIRELKLYYNKDYNFQTIYFGGGTPSLLSIENFQKIFNELSFDSETEITVEINPSSSTKEKLLALKNLGVNRISIGIQSFNNKYLKILGRLHDANLAVATYKLAREIGFKNISLDLMFSLPNQSIEELKEDLEILFKLDPDHFSIYSLIWEEGTKFYEKLEKNIFTETDNHLETKMFELILTCAKENNYIHYEISNFAKENKENKKNYESKQNNIYWENKEYIGIGISASGYIENKRYNNVRNFNSYYDSLDKNIFPIEDYEILSEDEKEKYKYLGGLRQLNKFTDLDKKYFEIAKELEQKDYIIIKDNKIKLTQKGLLFYNDVVLNFL